MRSIVRAGIASAAACGGLAAGGLATPASAQPINVGNLVNVNTSNVLNNNDVDVTVPITAAANICGVSVIVLAQDLAGDNTATCEARSGQIGVVTD